MLRKNPVRINPTSKITFSLNAILIWGIAALFTIFQLFLEMLTNTMTSSLMSSFNISHTSVGLLSSAFFYTFLVMQFPVGIILDKFDIRWVLTLACAGCGAGCLLFGHSTNFLYAFISRCIMGGFAAFGFLGLLKISAIWYPPKIFPFMVGFSQFLVMMITALGEPITTYYMNHSGWRIVLNYAGYIAFIIAILISFFVRDHKERLFVQNSGVWSFICILRNKQCWLAGVFGFGMFGTLAAFSALWGLTYLIKVYHLEAHEGALGISMNFMGVAFGCALFGFLSSYLKNYLVLIRLGSLAALLFIFILIFSSSLTISQIDIILFMLGIFCGTFFLCFDIVKKAVPAHSEGVAIAFCNIFVMGSTILLQPLMGFLIDFSGNYQLSMVALVCAISISFIVSIFMQKNIVNTESTSPLVFPPYIN